MTIKVDVVIQSSQAYVWQIITDIEGSAGRISAIEAIQVLERPLRGLVGLTWKETRVMFGKSATEVMWITDEKKGDSYQTRAKSHGSVYITRLALSRQDDMTLLSMEFSAIAQTLKTRIIWAFTGIFIKATMKKALRQDLLDIKAAAEQES